MTNEAILQTKKSLQVLGVPETVYWQKDVLDAMNAARQDEREKMQFETPPDSVGWIIPLKEGTVNSILTSALRFLGEDGMIALRDALIERTPKSGITAKWNEDEQVYDFIDGKGEGVEAVEFAEWVLEQGYDRIIGTNIWETHGGFQKTTPELYELFLKSKSKP